jgi:glutamate dehydrogenase (NAD(P)+)
MTTRLRCFVAEPDSGLRAFVVVDSLVGGRAMGGTRMADDVTVEEVAELARKMTLKLALAEIPIGGAKAGILHEVGDDWERDRVLAAFGHCVAPLLHGGVYLGTDQGIAHRDRDFFFAAAGFDVRTEACARAVPCAWEDLWGRCDQVAGFGVCEALDAAVEILGLRDRCRTVAIQGFGVVGRAVATGLTERGFAVTAVADRDGTIAARSPLPLEELLEATDTHGTIDRRRLPLGLERSSTPEAWLDVDADVLVLAAGTASVNERNVDRVRASVVVEAGNIACSEAANRALRERGVLVLPDILVNVGSAALTGLMLTGAPPPELELDPLVDWLFTEIAARIRRNVAHVVDRAGSTASLTEVANAIATERAARMAAAEPRPAELAVTLPGA